MSQPGTSSEQKYSDNIRCLICSLVVRKVSGRKKIIKNELEIEDLAKLYDKSARIGDILCGKCRTQFFRDKSTLSQTQIDIDHEVECLSEVLSQSSMSEVEDNESSQASMLSSGSEFKMEIYSSAQHSETEYVDMPFKRVVSTHKYCFLCGPSSVVNLVSVPFSARIQSFIKTRVFVPEGNRCCRKHLLKKRFYEDEFKLFEIYSHSSTLSLKDIPLFLNQMAVDSDESYLNKMKDFYIPEERLHTLTGLTWEQLIKLREQLTSMRNSPQRTITQALIIFLFKLRSGTSNKTTSAVFEIKRDQCVSDMFHSVVNSFEKDILPHQFGLHAVDRASLISTQTSEIAKKLYDLNDQLVLIFDGTYLRHQKSTNNDYQRKSYSGQKKAPLCKPFTICTTSGYVVDMLGPFDGTKNDAQIMEIVMSNNYFTQLVRPNDVFVVDRGFRDVKATLENLGFKILMPALKGKRSQLTTTESNESRLVTKIRWVVESVHGVIKQKYRLLDRKLDNKLLPIASTLCKIACFLNNEFGQRFYSDKEDADIIIERIKNNVNTENTLATDVEELRWDRRKVPFKKLTSSDILDFPELSDKELKIFFTGSYQLSQSVSYLAELLDDENNLALEYVKERPNIIKILVKSRHINKKTYKCYIEYVPDTDDIDGISRYCCDCANGRRTVGCCSHIAAIIYFLSNARYKSKIVRPAQILSKLFSVDNREIIINEDSDED